MKNQKNLKASLLTLSDGSFLICIPLWDEDMESFRKELKSYFKRRGEETMYPSGLPLFLVVFTKLEGDQLVRLSNRLIRKRRSK